MKKWLGRILSITALGFVAYLIIQGIGELDSSVLRFDFAYFLLATIVGSLFFILRIIGYKILMNKKGYVLNTIIVGYYLSSSELIRYIPGNIWGLFARISNAEKYGVKKTDASFLILEETALLFFSASFLSGIGLLLTEEIDLFWKITGAALMLSPALFTFFPWIVKRGTSVIGKLFRTFEASYTPEIKQLILLAPLYLLLWIIYGISHYFLFRAFFDITPSIILLTFFSILAWLAGYASFITPSGAGVRELIFTLSTAKFIPTAIAATFSIVSRIWFTLLDVLIFLLLLILLPKRSLLKKS